MQNVHLATGEAPLLRREYELKPIEQRLGRLAQTEQHDADVRRCASDGGRDVCQRFLAERKDRA